MGEPSTVIQGIIIPSTDPFFLGVVGVHMFFGLGAVISGLAAMFATKGRGKHSTVGIIYFWCMSGVFLTMTVLSLMRWAEDYVLFLLGGLAFGLAAFGRHAARGRGLRTHAVCMGSSYIVLLTAFYVDNGKNLPIWRDLPHFTYWLGPALVGVPLILRVLARHPLLRPRDPQISN